jgi:hypothetical protein
MSGFRETKWEDVVRDLVKDHLVLDAVEAEEMESDKVGGCLRKSSW